MAKTYNSIPTVATGDVYTATAHNNIAENVNNYRVPPICIARRNAAQSISNNSETSVSFDTEDVDTDGMFTATSTDITIQTAGVYVLTGVIELASTIDAVLIGRIKVGGNLVAKQRLHVSGGADLLDSMTLSNIKSLAVNDVVTMTIYQTNGGSGARNTAARTGLSVVWLGQAS